MSDTSKFLSAIEDALRKHCAVSLASSPKNMRNMIAYHMGWEGPASPGASRGKRLRPLLLLLVVDCLGKDWVQALPAAVAVEYLHNFSLIHDDIQDQSNERHGRQTLWMRWGIAQAINTGDAMFSLSYLALLNASTNFPPATVMTMTEIFSQACLRLTNGQHLDLAFEDQDNVTESEYLSMIQGKTASLLGCCARLGGILGHLSVSNQQLIEQFGFHLGIAFQIQDDILGIWGNPDMTGKSVVSDITSGKKTYPILHALHTVPVFKDAWLKDHESPTGLAHLLDILMESKSLVHSQSLVKKHTQESIDCLHRVFRNDLTACHPLENIASQLLERKV